MVLSDITKYTDFSTMRAANDKIKSDTKSQFSAIKSRRVFDAANWTAH